MGGRWGEGGRLFEAGRLLNFLAFRMGAYSRWALIRGGRLFEVGANSRLGAYSNKYGIFKIEISVVSQRK